MNIHEYQAKELLAKFGIGVPTGYPAMSVEEAVEGAKKLPGPLYVVKAQIHAGGRGAGCAEDRPLPRRHHLDRARHPAHQGQGLRRPGLRQRVRRRRDEPVHAVRHPGDRAR